jgi:hypothetical protein
MQAMDDRMSTAGGTAVWGIKGITMEVMVVGISVVTITTSVVSIMLLSMRGMALIGIHRVPIV